MDRTWSTIYLHSLCAFYQVTHDLLCILHSVTRFFCGDSFRMLLVQVRATEEISDAWFVVALSMCYCKAWFHMLLKLRATIGQLAKLSWLNLLYPLLSGGGVHIEGGSILSFGCDWKPHAYTWDVPLFWSLLHIICINISKLLVREVFVLPQSCHDQRDVRH